VRDVTRRYDPPPGRLVIGYRLEMGSDRPCLRDGQHRRDPGRSSEAVPRPCHGRLGRGDARDSWGGPLGPDSSSKGQSLTQQVITLVAAYEYIESLVRLVRGTLIRNTTCPNFACYLQLAAPAVLLTQEAAADPPLRKDCWMRALQFTVYGVRRSSSGETLRIRTPVRGKSGSLCVRRA